MHDKYYASASASQLLNKYPWPHKLPDCNDHKCHL